MVPEPPERFVRRALPGPARYRKVQRVQVLRETCS
jgi:hypothetical protein